MSTRKFNSEVLVSAAKTLYLDEETADVHFVFESSGQSERVPAHKLLLIAASKVFRVMFNGQWTERDEVPIPDVAASDFKIFLQYFYLNEIELSMESVEGVMNLGNQYDIDACLDDCATLLEHNLTEENACWIYGLAILFKHEELKTECETFFSLKTEAIFKSKGFLECCRETLSHILRLDSMSCSETDVFNACMVWVKSVSEQNEISMESIQNHLGNLFYDIRFGSMTMDEFKAIYETNKCLFSADELKDITEMIKSKKTQWKSFNKIRRMNPWERTAVLHCNREANVTLETYDIREIETATFISNKTLLLKEIVCSEVYEGIDSGGEPCELEEDLISELTVLEIDPFCPGGREPRILYVDNNVKLRSDENAVILLSRPLIIRRGFKYEIRLEQYVGRSAVTCTTLSTKVKMKSDIMVKFDKGPVWNGENWGLVWELRFIEV